MSPDGRSAKMGAIAGLRRWSLMGFTLSALSPVASIFITGSVLLKIAGTGAALILVAGAAIATLAALLYAEVAGAAPHAGGIYAGLRLLLGQWASDITIALTAITAPAYLAFSAKGVMRYLAVAVPGTATFPTAIAALLVAGIGASLRLRSGIIVATTLLFIELLVVGALVWLAATGIVHSPSEIVLRPVVLVDGGLSQPGAITLAFGTIAATFACSGTVWGAYLGEETAQTPRRFGSTLALTGFVGTLLVGIPLVLVIFAVPDLKATFSSDSPLAYFLTVRAGSAMGQLISLAIAAAIFANLMAMTIALARFLFATGREGLWPANLGSRFAAIDSRGVPFVATAILVTAALPFLLLSEKALAIMLSAELVSPLLVAIAVLVGRKKVGGLRYRVPAYPILPLIGALLACLFLLLEWNDAELGRKGLIAMGVVMLLTAATQMAGPRRKASSVV